MDSALPQSSCSRLSLAFSFDKVDLGCHFVLVVILSWLSFCLGCHFVFVAKSQNWCTKTITQYSCGDPRNIVSHSGVQRYDLSYIHQHLHHLWVYYELTTWPAPSWLDSSVGRTLHLYQGHRFVSCSSLNFFQAWISQLLKLHSYITAIVNHIFILFHIITLTL